MGEWKLTCWNQRCADNFPSHALSAENLNKANLGWFIAYLVVSARTSGANWEIYSPFASRLGCDGVAMLLFQKMFKRCSKASCVSDLMWQDQVMSIVFIVMSVYKEPAAD